MPSITEDEIYFGYNPIDDLRQRVNTERPTPEQVDAGRNAFAQEALNIAPITGEALSARDAWEASGAGGQALAEGRYGDAAGHYVDMATGTIGAIPLAGALARGSKRVGKWLDENLHPAINALTDLMPKDPASQTNLFAGPGAKTADLGALQRAQEMQSQGVDRSAIWQQTGWFQGVDGEWRFEIDDSTALLHPSQMAMHPHELMPNSRQDDMSKFMTHPELYDAYPDLAQLKTTYNPEATRADYWGTYYPGTKDRPENVVVNGASKSPLSTNLHEVQHAIQQRERFATGGNHETAIAPIIDDINGRLSALARQIDSASPIEAVELKAEYNRLMDARTQVWNNRDEIYRRLAGEVEARAVQMRRHMNADERRAVAPWNTPEYIPEDKQIVRFPDGGQNAMASARSPMLRRYGTETPWTGYRHDDIADDVQDEAARRRTPFEQTNAFRDELRSEAEADIARRAERANRPQILFQGRVPDWDNTEPTFWLSAKYVNDARGQRDFAIQLAKRDMEQYTDPVEQARLAKVIEALETQWTFGRPQKN